MSDWRVRAWERKMTEIEALRQQLEQAEVERQQDGYLHQEIAVLKAKLAEADAERRRVVGAAQKHIEDSGKRFSEYEQTIADLQAQVTALRAVLQHVSDWFCYMANESTLEATVNLRKAVKEALAGKEQP